MTTPDVVTDGLKHDGGKLRLDLVPPEIIEAVGTVMTHGVDSDSGLPHLWHIACNVAFLCELDMPSNLTAKGSTINENTK